MTVQLRGLPTVGAGYPTTMVEGLQELRRRIVALDEEAARLIQYQQSYQAAAKVLQVAQQIFDTLLQTAAG